MAAGLGLVRDYGVIVSDVWPGGPAEAAGLEGRRHPGVRSTASPPTTCQRVIYNFRLRDSTEQVQLVVLRGGTQHSLSVDAVEERSEFDSVSAHGRSRRRTSSPSSASSASRSISASPPRRRASGIRYGVIVVARAAGAASEVPLQPKDVIRSVNSRQIATLQALRDEARALKPGAPVTLQIQREGRLMYVSFTLD